MVISKKDRKVIEYQIARKAENLYGIARYCPFHKPAVLITYPYDREKNRLYPTTYWLSCPYLVKKVSQIEDQGLVKELTAKYYNDPDFYQELKKAHRDYARRRIKLLKDTDIKALENKNVNIRQVIYKSGVGGIREDSGVKCLHTHLADFLVHADNPLGKYVWKLVSWPVECDICAIGEDE